MLFQNSQFWKELTYENRPISQENFKIFKLDIIWHECLKYLKNKVSSWPPRLNKDKMLLKINFTLCYFNMLKYCLNFIWLLFQGFNMVKPSLLAIPNVHVKYLTIWKFFVFILFWNGTTYGNRPIWQENFKILKSANILHVCLK